MHNAIQHFRTNIERVRALGGLYAAICRLTTSALDASDVLRAQIMLAVSALDHYVHEITRLGMIEVCCGKRGTTKGFLRFQVNMNAALAGLTSTGGTSWLEDEIRERHSYVSFQSPDRIADAIRLFSPCELWPSVAAGLGLEVREVKERLSLIVDRRNKIAHEADMDPSYPGTRWPISHADVTNSVDFVERICETIHAVVV